MSEVFNIEKETEKNTYFRQVKATDRHLQLTYVSLSKGEEIGEEIHKDTDQFVRVEDGEGKVILDGKSYEIKDGFAVLIPQGTKHNIIGTGEEPLKLYILYSKQMHPENEKVTSEEEFGKKVESFTKKMYKRQ